MHRTLRTPFLLAGLCGALQAAAPALAQGAAPAAVPPPPQLSSLPLPPAAAPARNAPAAAAPSAPAAASAAASAPAAVAAGGTRRVIEDDNVRIEETRVRGQLQRVTVHNKTTGKAYEVLVGPGGRDPSQKREAAGSAAWSLFSF